MVPQFGAVPAAESLKISVSHVSDPSDVVMVFILNLDKKVGAKEILECVAPSRPSSRHPDAPGPAFRRITRSAVQSNVHRIILATKMGVTSMGAKVRLPAPLPHGPAPTPAAPRSRRPRKRAYTSSCSSTKTSWSISRSTSWSAALHAPAATCPVLTPRCRPAQVPEHHILSNEDKVALLKRYRLQESQLPRIQRTDPVARYFGVVKGQVRSPCAASEAAGRQE